MSVAATARLYRVGIIKVTRYNRATAFTRELLFFRLPRDVGYCYHANILDGILKSHDTIVRQRTRIINLLGYCAISISATARLYRVVYLKNSIFAL